MRRRARIALGVAGICFILFAEMGLVYQMGYNNAIMGQMK